MSTARTPPGPPPSGPTPIERAKATQSPEVEFANLGRAETATAQNLQVNEGEMKRLGAAIDGLNDLIQQQIANLQELRGLKHRVVNLSIFRQVKRMLHDNQRNRDIMKDVVEEKKVELDFIREALESIRARRAELSKDLVRGKVLEFGRKP